MTDARVYESLAIQLGILYSTFRCPRVLLTKLFPAYTAVIEEWNFYLVGLPDVLPKTSQHLAS
jgi:hypothetical protein